MVEHLPFKERVIGSSPIRLTSNNTVEFIRYIGVDSTFSLVISAMLGMLAHRLLRLFGILPSVTIE